MKSAQFAAVVEDVCSTVGAGHLERILESLGIPWQVFHDTTHLIEAVLNGSLRGVPIAVISPLTAIDDLLAERRQDNGTDILSAVHSLFLYVTEDTKRCSKLLQVITSCAATRLVPLEGGSVEVIVSKIVPDFTGPMHGLRLVVKTRACDRALMIERDSTFERIIDGQSGVFFGGFQYEGVRCYVSCSCEIPDLNRPVNGHWYDVKDDFLSAVPLVMYLKWAFFDVCWQPNELGACMIIDDPILRIRYGYCDFHQLNALMQEHSFSSNIAFIPWNWRRTSAKMASLVRSSEGRLSISVHGCDHTLGEFGINAFEVLNGKVGLAKQRMECHRERSGISHDLVMVFPQGIFSKKCLRVLQQHQFVAAVNTGMLAINCETDSLTIGDMWGVAMQKYGNFPVFSRRYPAHGLENFAFDLLLGKPCLIVEHHEFFKEDAQHVIKFIRELNSINCCLKWRSLGEVINRSYQWRMVPDNAICVRMFANELLLSNATGAERYYQIEKADRGSVGTKNVYVNHKHVDWKIENETIKFAVKIPAGEKALIQVKYATPQEPMIAIHSVINTLSRAT